jgi:hypothetical protein
MLRLRFANRRRTEADNGYRLRPPPYLTEAAAGCRRRVGVAERALLVGWRVEVVVAVMVRRSGQFGGECHRGRGMTIRVLQR